MATFFYFKISHDDVHIIKNSIAAVQTGTTLTVFVFNRFIKGLSKKYVSGCGVKNPVDCWPSKLSHPGKYKMPAKLGPTVSR